MRGGAGTSRAAGGAGGGRPRRTGARPRRRLRFDRGPAARARGQGGEHPLPGAGRAGRSRTVGPQPAAAAVPDRAPSHPGARRRARPTLGCGGGARAARPPGRRSRRPDTTRGGTCWPTSGRSWRSAGRMSPSKPACCSPGRSNWTAASDGRRFRYDAGRGRAERRHASTVAALPATVGRRPGQGGGRGPPRAPRAAATSSARATRRTPFWPWSRAG